MTRITQYERYAGVVLFVSFAIPFLAGFYSGMADTAVPMYSSAAGTFIFACIVYFAYRLVRRFVTYAVNEVRSE